MNAASHPAPFDAESEVERVEIVAKSERRLGRFRLVYQIASGGMATVYLGRVMGPAGVERPVAIKRIHPHLARRKQFVAMFLDEARIASRISHPNVCSLYDFGEIDGVYYMAMEYLVGVPLTRLIRGVARDPERLASSRWHAFAARIAADAAEGLHAAHELRDDKGQELGIVHRDVSPQNVFVTQDGAVKVVDFGIALARDRLSQTNTGTLKGKFGYMAPEHASGGDVDRRADVWSLGVCLWEMLVGARLFRRKNDMETLLAVRNETLEPPSTHSFGVPAELDRIVMRALSRDPSKRYETTRALGRDLSEWVRKSGESVTLPELAEWMKPLFGDAHSEQLELVRTVMESQVVETGDRRSTASIARSFSGKSARERRALWRNVGIAAGAIALIALGAFGGGLLRGEDQTGDGELVDPPRADRAGAPGQVPAREAAIPMQPVTPARAPEAVAAGEAEAEALTEPEAVTGTEAATESETRPATEESGEAERTVRDRRRARAARRRAAARASAESESAPTAYGHADVVAVGGWAEIFDGARSLGRTPTRVRLPVGRHVLTVRPFGEGAPRRVRVNVPADGVARVVVPIEGAE